MQFNDQPPSRVLVCDDDPFLAAELEMILTDAGLEVAGPTRTVAESFRLLDQTPVDAAVLDVNLKVERSDALADRLAAEGVPFLFLSGYQADNLPERHRHRPYMTKPLREKELLTILRELLALPKVS